jgi:HSP20 family molecular chaperone IbpA
MRLNHAKDTGHPKLIEPDTVVFDEGKVIRIQTSLPDVSEEKISIGFDAGNAMVTIAASHDGKKYTTALQVPCDVQFREKRFREGVLTIILEKTGSWQPHRWKAVVSHRLFFKICFIVWFSAKILLYLVFHTMNGEIYSIHGVLRHPGNGGGIYWPCPV